MLEESAWNGKQRTLLKEAEQAARLGEYQVLLCWALDRLTRERAEAMLRVMREFRERGCQVISVQEPWTEAPGIAGDGLVGILGWVTSEESRRRSERVKAGLARRRSLREPVARAGQPGQVDRPTLDGERIAAVNSTGHQQDR